MASALRRAYSGPFKSQAPRAHRPITIEDRWRGCRGAQNGVGISRYGPRGSQWARARCEVGLMDRNTSRMMRGFTLGTVGCLALLVAGAGCALCNVGKRADAKKRADARPAEVADADANADAHAGADATANATAAPFDQHDPSAAPAAEAPRWANDPQPSV